MTERKMTREELISDGKLSLKRLRGEVEKWIYYEGELEDGHDIEVIIAEHIKGIIDQGITYEELGTTPEEINKFRLTRKARNLFDHLKRGITVPSWRLAALIAIDIRRLIEEGTTYGEVGTIPEEIEELMKKRLPSGKLHSGKDWEIIPSRKKAVEKGEHLILHVVDDPSLSKEERSELISLGNDFAITNAPEEEMFRVAVNGLKQGTRAFTHVHIIFPIEDDELPRLIDKIPRQK